MKGPGLQGTVQEQSTIFGLTSRTAFFALLVSRLYAALYAPIQDCDEVFNFWEPTHYINHGFGMQTWELSPEYAIRSWMYTAIHALPLHLASWTPFISNKVSEFYFMRIVLALVCYSCETRLYTAVAHSMSPRIAMIYLLASMSGAGLFHASVSYLPSSFGMYSLVLGASACLDRSLGSNIVLGLTWMALATVLGWPFVAVVAVPFVLEEIATSFGSKDVAGLFQRMTRAAASALLILASEVGVDSLFYRKLVCVPFNIVWYNVFASGKGPDIYGTEPWHFYIRNLVINFNIWFLLACIALPLLFLQRLLGTRPESRLTAYRSVTILSPFYIWLAVFTAQPHKEERFMYPIYPFLCLNAAVSLHIVVLNLGATSPGSVIRFVPAWLRLLIVSVLVMTAMLLGIGRSAGLATAYSAPLTLFSKVQDHVNATSSLKAPVNICIGKEWYRFPSSYHIPDYARLKFIKSEFTGLLPGTFSEATDPALGLLPGTYLIPSGMNDENLEDIGKYTAIEECDYLIDSSFTSSRPTELEQDFVHDREHWDPIECLPFLDVGSTGLLGRLFWAPDIKLLPVIFRRNWGEYCLLKSRTR